jgi:hypothetical protein
VLGRDGVLSYTIESLEGPGEGGVYTLNAVGQRPECRVQVRITPLSGTTMIGVLFGAACPFE